MKERGPGATRHSEEGKEMAEDNTDNFALKTEFYTLRIDLISILNSLINENS